MLFGDLLLSAGLLAPSRQETTGGGRRHRNMQGGPRPIFLSFPESLNFTAVPHWISTEPKLPVTAGEITAITINVNSVVPDDATIVGRLQKGNLRQATVA